MFRILTYNIHRAIGLDRRFRLDRTSDILNHYQADIVLLQEVDCGAPRSKSLELVKELATELGYQYFEAGYNVKLKKGKYGNATLSKFPISDQANIDLTHKLRKKRGCQYTKIKLQSGQSKSLQLAAFNLHLGLLPQERAEQVGRLAQASYFKKLKSNQACIVAGDFNDWRNLLSPVFTSVMDFNCATNYKHDNNDPIRTFPSISPTGGLDKIFYRGPIKLKQAFRCRLGISKIASDHLPVIADFEIK